MNRMLRIPKCLPVITSLLLLAAAASAQEDRAAPLERAGEKPWTVHVGVGSSRAWNFVGVSRDFLRTGGFSLYWTAGLGTILAGVGGAYHTNRDGNGLVLSANLGVVGYHANAAVQLRLSDFGYLVGGVSAGTYFMQHSGLLPVLAYEHRF